MKPLKIIFMGSPDFAVPSLERLFESDHVIEAVVSGPDKRRGRRSKPEPTAVKKCALELGLPTIDVDDVKSKESEEILRKLNADLFVVVAFKVLPEVLLELPGKGAINLHASLLPKYRGAAPIHWAVINGEEETGCTVFFLEKSVDTGNVIDQVKTPIKPNETTGDVYNRLQVIGAELLVECVNQIANNSITLSAQDDAEATPAPKLFKKNTKLNFGDHAQNIHNKIRGLNPFPTAWCMYDDEKMNVYQSEVGPEKSLNPGELVWFEDKLLVGCGTGTVQLKSVQLPGTKRLAGKEFANGYDLTKQID
ncbi:MAG: methionyl-tRNA formyltransferase [Balneolaceae bacterium]